MLEFPTDDTIQVMHNVQASIKHRLSTQRREQGSTLWEEARNKIEIKANSQDIRTIRTITSPPIKKNASLKTNKNKSSILLLNKS